MRLRALRRNVWAMGLNLLGRFLKIKKQKMGFNRLLREWNEIIRKMGNAYLILVVYWGEDKSGGRSDLNVSWVSEFDEYVVKDDPEHGVKASERIRTSGAVVLVDATWSLRDDIKEAYAYELDRFGKSSNKISDFDLFRKGLLLVVLLLDDIYNSLSMEVLEMKDRDADFRAIAKKSLNFWVTDVPE
jgi:hypothetical protein